MLRGRVRCTASSEQMALNKRLLCRISDAKLRHFSELVPLKVTLPRIDQVVAGVGLNREQPYPISTNWLLHPRKVERMAIRVAAERHQANLWQKQERLMPVRPRQRRLPTPAGQQKTTSCIILFLNLFAVFQYCEKNWLYYKHRYSSTIKLETRLAKENFTSTDIRPKPH